MSGYAGIGSRLAKVKESLPQNVRLVAVSKFHPVEALESAYAAGQRTFGESHEQELSKKQAVLPKDIDWHFIGHLQTNKVKYIAPYISMIDAVDSLKLLKEINKQAAKHDRVIKVLLELHIAEEATKYGFTPDGLRQMLAEGEWRQLKNVEICGLMAMATNTDDEIRIRKDFNLAASLFDEIKSKYFADADSFCERSWGMSGDYKVAVECRSTMVRIGTAIFGEREY